MVKQLLTVAAAVMTAAMGWAQTTFPATIEITDEASFASWTVIDANATTSANTWGYDATNSEALYPEDKKNAANDWLISPAIYLEPGKYEVSGYVIQRSSYSSDKQAFELTFGAEATVAGQTTFANVTSYQSKLYTATTGNVVVTTAGNYHFAIHLKSSSYMGNCGFKKFVINKLAPVPAHVSDLAVAAGENGALQAIITWTNPTKDSDGNDLQKFSGVKVKHGTTVLATLNGAVGEAMTYVDNTITNAGRYTYSVIPFNEDGEAAGTAPTATSNWIGTDTPKPVTDLAASTDGSKVTLTFTAPTESANGGYVDWSALTYRISRNSTVLNEAFSGTTFEDSVTSLGSYTYSVQAQADGKRAAAQSVTVRAGEGFPVPYSETFDAASSLDLFTIINVSGGSRTWNYNSTRKCAQYWGNATNADQWLITPPVILEAGKTYELKFNAGLENAVSTSSYKQLNVYVGKGDKVEDQTTELFGELISSAIMNGKTAYFTAPANGGYNFGFRVTGATNTYSIFVDNISVKVAEVIPAAVGEFKAEAAAEGALAANISWVNPSKAVSGLDLESLDKVEVYRGSDLVYTDENPQVGAACAIIDAVEAAGSYTYKAYAYVGTQKSAVATSTVAWVGPDTPAAPAAATLALVEGKPVVTFNAVTAGVNGGYINTAALTYTITRNPDAEVVAEGIKDTTFTDNAVLSLAKYSYTIVAKVGEQESAPITTNALVIGDALELPWETSLASEDEAAIWAFYDANADGKTWSYNTRNADLETGFGAKDGDAAFTPPFHTLKGDHILTYSIHGYSSRYGDAYNVVIANNGDFAGATTIAEYGDKDIAFSMFESRTINFRVEAEGTYHIGFVQKASDPWGIYLKDVKIERVIPTGVNDLDAKAVKSVRYFNLMGVESAGPVEGVNIVVTTYTDGTTSSAKVIR
ncbi:MAG: hypothetical protein Q4B68_09465 [Bacteroidales bacterium]|nr:hypothetical protein [Bacteroidales bacterium]